MPNRIMAQFDKMLCTFLILIGLAVMLFLVKTGTPDNTLLEWIKTFVSTVTGFLGGLITNRAVQRGSDGGLTSLDNGGADSKTTATRTTETKSVEEVTTDKEKSNGSDILDPAAHR